MIRRLSRTLREKYTLLSLQLGARVLTFWSALAAAAGIEILGFVAVWPLTIVGVAVAAAAITYRRRRVRRDDGT